MLAGYSQLNASWVIIVNAAVENMNRLHRGPCKSLQFYFLLSYYEPSQTHSPESQQFTQLLVKLKQQQHYI